jgi:hypothetical protein
MKEPKILKNDEEENDPKFEMPKKDSKGEANEWKSKIEGISDKKILSYIADLAYAKRSMLDADSRLNEKEEEPPTVQGAD